MPRYRWAGLRPRARSRAPMLGAWPGRPGHFIANGGFKIGPLFGFGLRFWALKWLAVTFTFHSIVIKRNSAGFDRTGDTDPNNPNVLVIDKKDENWENLMSFTIGVSFFLPTNAPRSK